MGYTLLSKAGWLSLQGRVWDLTCIMHNVLKIHFFVHHVSKETLLLNATSKFPRIDPSRTGALEKESRRDPFVPFAQMANSPLALTVFT